MNLKESMEQYMEEFGGRKGKGEKMHFWIISKPMNF